MFVLVFCVHFPDHNKGRGQKEHRWEFHREPEVMNNPDFTCGEHMDRRQQELPTLKYND